MKLMKRLAAAMLMLAVAVSCFSMSSMEAQAAPKTTTYIMDSKKGVYYPTKIRVGVNERYGTTNIYLKNEGDYVASVKTNSSDIIAKITEKANYLGDNYTSVWLNDDDRLQFKSRFEITCFARKTGTYTLTFTVKNAKKKTVCTKKIKVYAEQYGSPIKSFKYAGKEYYSGSCLTTKGKGKLQVTMNKGFKLQKIEVGTYVDGEYEEWYPEPVFKTVKNKTNISLATSTKYVSDVYKYGNDSDYSYKYGYYTDYLYPVTVIRVTYKDMKLGIVQTEEYNMFYQNK